MSDPFVTGNDGFVQFEWRCGSRYLELEFCAEGVVWLTQDGKEPMDTGELRYTGVADEDGVEVWEITVAKIRELIAWAEEGGGCRKCP